LFLYNELAEARLQENEQKPLEEKLDKLNNIEEIKHTLSEALELSVHEDTGLQSLLFRLENSIQRTAAFSKEYEALANRISSVKIELDDIISELETENEQVDFNPNDIEILNDRLQTIYTLQKKHHVGSIAELLQIQETLSEKVGQVESADEIILQKEKEIRSLEKKLDEMARVISGARIKMIPELQKKLTSLLSDLGMKNARFSITITPAENYFSNGKDTLEFLFSANKGGSFGNLKKVASGGELSRIMLSTKKILSENIQLPTIIFDEIDSGVSGKVSDKMATIMQQMSRHMQVISITHLPQIAAKGDQHYKVFKEEANGNTRTNLKQLSNDERIVEVAEMLSGKDISDSAITHAKELLN